MKRNKIIIFILSLLIVLCLAVGIYFLYYINDSNTVRLIGTICIALILLVWLFYEYRYRTKGGRLPYFDTPEQQISRFVLINTDNNSEKEWHVSNNSSFLIGKGNEVDIELGDTQYCDYISAQHAVLNCCKGYWYIEDLSSKNGVGIKRAGEEYSLRLKPEILYKINVGDIIYISKAKIIAM